MPENRPPDITPVLREDARRLTYAELAEIRGISRTSAERLVRRKRWTRQLGNDGVVRVLVPPDQHENGSVSRRREKGNARSDNRPRHPAPDVTPGGADIAAVIREAMAPLIRP